MAAAAVSVAGTAASPALKGAPMASNANSELETAFIQSIESSVAREPDGAVRFAAPRCPLPTFSPRPVLADPHADAAFHSRVIITRITMAHSRLGHPPAARARWQRSAAPRDRGPSQAGAKERPRFAKEKGGRCQRGRFQSGIEGG